MLRCSVGDCSARRSLERASPFRPSSRRRRRPRSTAWTPHDRSRQRPFRPTVKPVHGGACPPRSGRGGESRHRPSLGARQSGSARCACSGSRGRATDVLFASSGFVAAWALKKATTTIPIVFLAVGEPVAAGLVASLEDREATYGRLDSGRIGLEAGPDPLRRPRPLGIGRVAHDTRVGGAHGFFSQGPGGQPSPAAVPGSAQTRRSRSRVRADSSPASKRCRRRGLPFDLFAPARDRGPGPQASNSRDRRRGGVHRPRIDDELFDRLGASPARRREFTSTRS